MFMLGSMFTVLYTHAGTGRSIDLTHVASTGHHMYLRNIENIWYGRYTACGESFFGCPSADLSVL